MSESQSTAMRARLAVLISGRGSNLRALISAISAGRLNADIVAVGSDRADAPGLQFAAHERIPLVLCPRAEYPDRASFESALFDQLQAFQPDWIILAGFMRVLSAQAVARCCGRMLNLHPSLLPRYPGLHTHQRVLDAGDVEHGASVHLVTAELDGGPVLAQSRISVAPGDDAADLAARLQPLEHELLIEAVSWLAQGRVRMQDGALHFDGRPLAEPIRIGEGPRAQGPENRAQGPESTKASGAIQSDAGTLNRGPRA